MTSIALFIISAIRSSICVSLAAIGGTFATRSGIMPMGIEGFVLMGAFCAAAGSHYSGNPFIGLLCGILGTLLFALLHAMMCIKFSMNQIVCGVGFNLFSLGFTASMTQIIWGTRAFSDNVVALPAITLPGLGRVSCLLPAPVIIAVVSWIFLFKTVPGLRMRIVGENAFSAKTIGIAAKKYRYLGCALCGMLCGLAGSYLSIAHVDRFTYNMSAGRGYIAVGVNILGSFNPIGSLVASLLFGFSDALKNIFTDGKIPSQIIDMVPYIVTILVLVFSTRSVQGPAGIGKSDEEEWEAWG